MYRHECLIVLIQIGSVHARRLVWTSAVETQGVTECATSACNPAPCASTGQCQINNDGTTHNCLCTLGYSGANCSTGTYTLTLQTFQGLTGI